MELSGESHSVYSIHDLYKKYVDRKHKDHQIYRTLRYDVFKRIEDRDNKGMYNMTYTIPMVVYGNTRYKVSTCMNYLLTKISGVDETSKRRIIGMAASKH